MEQQLREFLRDLSGWEAIYTSLGKLRADLLSKAAFAVEDHLRQLGQLEGVDKAIRQLQGLQKSIKES